MQASTLKRRTDYFNRAREFLPERWLPEATKNPDSPYFHDRRHAVQLFTGGPRNRLGQNLAWAEMQLILAKLV